MQTQKDNQKTVLKKQIDFLRLIHPFLNETMYHTECIELRVIKRQANLPNYKSLNLWRTDNKSLEYYETFLNKINNKPVCVYYSVFSFDYNKECYKADGKPFQKGRINNQNSLYTQILIMDFDNISEEEYQKQKDIFKKLDIETISVFTGNGYQDIILLKEKVYDTKILKSFTDLLISKGFNVDPTIIDPARIMRMPYTYNCKAFDSKSKNYSEKPKAIRTYIKNKTEKRYPVSEIFDKINMLPDKNKKTTKIKSDSELEDKLISFPALIEFKKIYPALENYNIPVAIKNMLMSTREGYRNKALLFLVPYLRNGLNLDITTIKKILSIWAANCKPQLDVQFVKNEIDRLLTYDFNKKAGKYDESMKKEFGALNLKNKKDVYKKNEGKVIIPNKIFDLYSSLSDCSVKIYFLMKVQENLKNKSSWTTDELLQFTKISTSTFYRNIPHLLDAMLVEKIEMNRKTGQPTTYSLKNCNLSKGFTIFDPGTIENMVFNENKKLTDGEIKLYTYLYYSTGSNGETWKSQETIGKAINKKRNSISEMTDSLSKKEYLIKEIFVGEDNKPHNRYIINYMSSSSSSSSSLSVYY